MRMKRMLLLMVGFLLCSQVAVGAETVELLSQSTNGKPSYAYFPALSSDGKWAAFSAYSGLLPEDRNNVYDIYVRNLVTGGLERVSVASDGSEANGVSQSPDLSADGRFVVFDSWASNLVPGDVNGTCDVFLRDRLNGTTEIVSIATSGASGEYGSSVAAISADGRFVVFNTLSRFAADDVTLSMDVYLRDRLTRTTSRVAGGIFPALSGDGRYVAAREGKSLVLRDLRTGAAEIVAQFAWEPINTNPNAYIPAISDDGRYVVYEGWSALGAPLSTEVFVYDRFTRNNRQITRAYDGSPLTTAAGPYGASLRPKISGDGRSILFFSCAADLVQGVDGNQLYRYDLVDQSMTRLPLDNPWATTLYPLFDLSRDGSVVVFQDTIMNHLPQYLTSAFGVFVLRPAIPLENDGTVEGDGSDEEGEGEGEGDNSPDVLAPAKIVAEPGMLWPANSKLTDVKLSVDAPGATAVEVRIVDEYGTFSQTLHGAALTVPLEAWRNGGDKDGRSYTITAVATDAAGRQTTATTTITVPHDKR